MGFLSFLCLLHLWPYLTCTGGIAEDNTSGHLRQTLLQELEMCTQGRICGMYRGSFVHPTWRVSLCNPPPVNNLSLPHMDRVAFPFSACTKTWLQAEWLPWNKCQCSKGSPFLVKGIHQWYWLQPALVIKHLHPMLCYHYAGFKGEYLVAIQFSCFLLSWLFSRWILGSLLWEYGDLS